MCGLYGWLRDASVEANRGPLAIVTKALTILNEDRGDESTGWAWQAPNGGTPRISKNANTGSKFSRESKELVEEIYNPANQTAWLIGHTRQSTVGPIDEENAHPFHFGSIVGAHNGHISNFRGYDIPKDRYKLPECDSAHFFAYADVVGVKKALRKTYGSLALTMSRHPYDRILLYQDLGDRLCLVYSRSLKALIWSSEQAHLERALAMADIGVDGKDTHFVIFPFSTLLRIGPEGLHKPRIEWREELVSCAGASWRRGLDIAGDDVDGMGYAGYNWNRNTTGDYCMSKEKAPMSPSTVTSTLPIDGGHQEFSPIKGVPVLWHGGDLMMCARCSTRIPEEWKATVKRLGEAEKAHDDKYYGEDDDDYYLTVYDKQGGQLIKVIRPVPATIDDCPACFAKDTVRYFNSMAMWECRKCRAVMDSHLSYGPEEETPTVVHPLTTVVDGEFVEGEDGEAEDLGTDDRDIPMHLRNNGIEADV